MIKQLRKSTYYGLDVGKFLCAILILIYHYFSEHGPLPGIIDEALSLYAIAVGLFMVISGFLLFDKLEKITGTQNRWNAVKKQVCRIYTIYLLWSIPYLAFTIYYWDWKNISCSFVFWQIQGWIFNSTFSTIWFMPMLAIGTIVAFWVTERLFKCAYFIGIVCYLLGSLTMTYSFLGDFIPGFRIFKSFADVWLGGSRGWLLYAFPLLLLGRYMVVWKSKVRTIPTAILSCVFVLLLIIEGLGIRKIAGVHTGIDLAIMMIPTVTCLLAFLISLKLPNGKCYIYIWMRSMSTLIFVSQRIFLTVLPTIFLDEFVLVYKNMWIGCGITIVSTLAFCAGIIYFSNKQLFLKKLF